MATSEAVPVERSIAVLRSMSLWMLNHNQWHMTVREAMKCVGEGDWEATKKQLPDGARMAKDLSLWVSWYDFRGKNRKIFRSFSHTFLVESIGAGGCRWNILQANGAGLQRITEPPRAATQCAPIGCRKRLGHVCLHTLEFHLHTLFLTKTEVLKGDGGMFFKIVLRACNGDASACVTLQRVLSLPV